ncbi:MAG: SAM-dependent methyltransferase [Kiritimatiellae bacterium]|nr:SAM-dependent methyltransferase [Kiritimatiellia bacterium]
MERFELDPKLKEEIRARVLGGGFMKVVQTVRQNGRQFKIAMRPVEIGGVKKFQAEMTDDGQVRVKNLDMNAAAEGLEEIIAQRGAREMHLMTAKGDLHMRVTKKGRVMVTRSAEMDRVVTVQPHDRVKKVPLTSFESSALLRAIGIADGSGKIRASMRGKYDQVNEFLKAVKETVRPTDGAFTVVDCGCGKTYLTISLYFYLTEVLKFPNVKVVGIDRRRDVIAAARKMSEQLDVADKVVFVEADLGALASIGPLVANSEVSAHSNNRASEHANSSVDMVVSLHACDTATDEALAKGVEWKARYILSAPCCQHELQKTLDNRGAFSGLMRQSILRERLCDILTDSFRAMILRILGFKVQVIEFVSSEATSRNIMLKCEYGVKPGQPGPIGEYLNLRDYWKVTPWLETRLEKTLGRHLERYV